MLVSLRLEQGMPLEWDEKRFSSSKRGLPVFTGMRSTQMGDYLGVQYPTWTVRLENIFIDQVSSLGKMLLDKQYLRCLAIILLFDIQKFKTDPLTITRQNLLKPLHHVLSSNKLQTIIRPPCVSSNPSSPFAPFQHGVIKDLEAVELSLDDASAQSKPVSESATPVLPEPMCSSKSCLSALTVHLQSAARQSILPAGNAT